MSDHIILNKFIGVLLGGCCGDILGSQTEGMYQQDIITKFGNIVRIMPERKLYTDDTEMTIVLARHLTRNNKINRNQIHLEYATQMSNVGYSRSTRSILTSFLKTTEIHPIGESSHNGAVMRIAPLGLIGLPDADLFLEIRNAIYYTHGNKQESKICGFIHCKIIDYLIFNKCSSKLDLFLNIINWTKQFNPLYVKINIIKFCLNSLTPINITEELMGDKNSFQIEAIDALCCALYIFLNNYENPVQAICNAASLGGDTDTIAKIVGDLCGALYGTEWIPIEWRNVQDEQELINLGTSLYRKRFYKESV